MPGLDRLPVAVSEAELHDIEAPEAFETSGSFLVSVTNHGRDAHVYLELDDDLAAGAQLSETNVYVERDATREVEVSADPDAGHVTGALHVETGYGAESAAVAVTIGTPDGPEIPVDEELGEPPGESAESADVPEPEPADPGGRSGPSLRRGWLPVAGLAVVALALAGGTAAMVDDPVVIAGVVAVLVGVVAAGAILVRR